MAYYLDVNVPKLVMVGAASTLLLAIVLLGVHGYYLKVEQDEFSAKYYFAQQPLLDSVRQSSDPHLHSYRWIDRNSQTVQLPIDRAIKVMAESKGNPPTTQPLGPR